jgi:hypothetical protein
VAAPTDRGGEASLLKRGASLIMANAQTDCHSHPEVRLSSGRRTCDSSG